MPTLYYYTTEWESTPSYVFPSRELALEYAVQEIVAAYNISEDEESEKIEDYLDLIYIEEIEYIDK